MAFDTYPSKLKNEIFWEITYEDVKSKIKLYMGEKQALIVQNFQSLTETARLALGGKEENTTNQKPVETLEDLKMGMASVFGG